MHPAEVVVGELERQRHFVILPLLAERIRQPGHPPVAHADGEIVPFNVARADLRHVR